MCICVSFQLFFLKILTHHDSSDADAHIPNDVEFAVEEVLDACFTVLQTTYMRSHVLSVTMMTGTALLLIH